MEAHKEISSTKQATLLIITDELGSSERRDKDIILEHTSKHFARFMYMLTKPPFANAWIVKNVGDSLMIRVEIEEDPSTLALLLRSVIDAQANLRTESSTGDEINIRVLVTKCDGAINGTEIQKSLINELYRFGLTPTDEAIVEKFPSITDWLNWDLFGTSIARAFRSSTIPTGGELVVDDSVTELMPDIGSCGGSFDGLQIGPRVAFSPIKGLADLYDVRKMTVLHEQLQYKDNKQRRKDHVWLRTVQLNEHCKGPQPKDTLKYRQQRILALTEMVIPDPQGIVHWQKALSQIENNARYLRYVGRTSYADSWIKVGRRHQQEKAKLADLIVLGAYPEFDTYFNIREAISELRLAGAKHSATKLLFARSNIFWEPRKSEDQPLWKRAKTGEHFVLILGRAHDNERSDTPDITKTVWGEAIPQLSIQGTSAYDSGEVMGEWDFYSIYHLGPGLTLDGKAIAEQCLRTLKGITERLRVYLCEAEEPYCA